MSKQVAPVASRTRAPRSRASGLFALGRQTLAGLRLLLVLTVVLGVVYPLVVAGIGQLLFGWRADGSLVDAAGNHQSSVDSSTVGSTLIGQTFEGDEWFIGRPSAAGEGYDTLASAGSNLGPENPDLVASIKDRRREIAVRESVQPGLVPADALTASASGLDPHISAEYATIQVARVAAARDLDASTVAALVDDHTSGRTLGILGEPRVNVLELNLALEGAVR